MCFPNPCVSSDDKCTIMHFYSSDFLLNQLITKSQKKLKDDSLTILPILISVAIGEALFATGEQYLDTDTWLNNESAFYSRRPIF